MRNAGHTTLMILKEKPADMIQAVRVVPILAPMMTEIAWTRVRRPALTNDTVITVVAVDDWTATVVNIPVRTPEMRFVVILLRTWRNCEPAIFCKVCS